MRRIWITWAVTLPLVAWAGGWPSVRTIERLGPGMASPRLDGGAFSGWEVFHDGQTDQPVLAFGSAVNAGRTPEEALAAVKKAARCRADFVLERTLTALSTTRSFFQETRDGLPVISGRADLVLDPQGCLTRWSLRAHDAWPTVDAHLLDGQTATTALAADLEPANWRLDAERSHCAWFPDAARHVLRPVWRLYIAGDSPHQRWQGIVDAVSGEVILDWPGIATEVISGTLRGQYWPEFIHETPQFGLHPHEGIRVNGYELFTDQAAQFSREAGSTANLQARLEGRYVNVDNDDAADGEMNLALQAPFAPLAWDWTTPSASAPELNLYYHTVFIHDWYKVLDPPFNGLDYPLPAVANYGHAYDNAFWNGYGTYYGSGAQYSNFAMFSDIIYHEYTHGVTDRIYGEHWLPYTGEPGAMNEAWSDYFACTINDDPYCAEYIMGGIFSSYFRNLENDLVYPRDWFGEVHYDSRFVSAALWEIRAALGQALGDSLAHFSRYGWADNFLDYLVAVLETDDDDHNLANGTPHSTVIYGAFGRHGIGPGDMPRFVIQNLTCVADGSGGSAGDGDRFYEAGEIIEMRFDLANIAPLYPPPASNVQISVVSDDPNVTILNGSQSVAELPAGSVHAVTPILVQIAATSPDHWNATRISVTSNGGQAQYELPLEFMIGTPAVLIVEDDPVTDVERFVPNALKSTDRIFDRVRLGSLESLSPDYLPQPGLVIWLSGDADGVILTAQDQTLLTGYLAGGGRMVLSGQNIADALPGTDFASNVLQVEIESDSLHSLAVSATGSPLVPGEWFVISGGNGAGNQHEESSFIPTGTAHEIARYGRSASGPIAAVECANGRGLLFGFGLEAISGMASGSTDLPTLLDQIYVWAADVLNASIEQPTAPLTSIWSLAPAYPNPFNGATMISYHIPEGRAGELVIYDVLGRLVESAKLTRAQGTFSWSPLVASGVYFAIARWEGGQTEPIKLQLVR